jgi:maintenance of morphology protein 1
MSFVAGNDPFHIRPFSTDCIRCPGTGAILDRWRFELRVRPLRSSLVCYTYSNGRLSFTQGFVLGQLSVVLLIGAFIKFFIFGEAPTADSSSSRQLSTLSPTHKRTVSFTTPASSQSKPRDLRHAASSHIIRPPPILTPATLLSKTYYNVAAHQPESLDWFNVLIAQTLAQLRTDAFADNAVLTSLTSILNGPQKPDFLEKIAVTEISLGEDFPIFSNCRVHPVRDDTTGGGEGRLQARMDVDLSDFITLGIETTLVLNYPRPRTAVLPVALSVSVVRFSGTLGISFLPASVPAGERSSTGAPGSPTPTPTADMRENPFEDGSNSPKRTPTTLAFAFQPNYTLSLSTRSLVGARSRLQDIPKIAQLVESRLRTWFEERCVAPRMQQVAVPSLWPRMKNVVEGEGKANEGPAGLGLDGTPISVGASGARERNLREEARREVEEERARANGREVMGDWEGLRRRGREGGSSESGSGSEHDMPGSMPGSMAS